MDLSTRKQNVLKVWEAFNSPSISVNERKEYNSFLTEFQASEEAFPIVIDFLNSDIASIHLFSACSLHKILRVNSHFLLRNEQHFLETKQILEQLIPKFSSVFNGILAKLCQCLSVLIAVGLFQLWPEGIEELTNTEDYTVLSIASLVLEGLAAEVNEIKMDVHARQAIEVNLRRKTNVISKFIIRVKNTLVSPTERLTIVTIVKELALYGLNPLEDPDLLQYMLSIFDQSTSYHICESLKESIVHGHLRELSLGSIPFSEIPQALDQKATDIIRTVIQIIEHASTKFESDQETLENVAILLDGVLDSCPFLFFLKDPLASTLTKFTLKYLTTGVREVTVKFYNSLSTLREYLCEQEEEIDLNEEDRKELYIAFQGLFFEIAKLSRMTELIMPSTAEVTYCSSEVADLNREYEEQPVVEFRKSAEQILYNLLLVILRLDKKSSVTAFFEQIDQLLRGDKCDKELAIFLLRTVAEVFEMDRGCNERIEKVVSLIMESELTSDSVLSAHIILLLDTYSCLLADNTELLKKATYLLLQYGRIPFYRDVAVFVANTIHLGNQNCVEEVYSQVREFLQQECSNLNASSVARLTEVACSSLCATQRSKGYSEISKWFVTLFDQLHLGKDVPQNTAAIKEILKFYSFANTSTHVGELFSFFLERLETLAAVADKYLDDQQVISNLLTSVRNPVMMLTELASETVERLFQLLKNIFLQRPEMHRPISIISIMIEHLAQNEETAKFVLQNVVPLAQTIRENCLGEQAKLDFKIMFIDLWIGIVRKTEIEPVQEEFTLSIQIILKMLEIHCTEPFRKVFKLIVAMTDCPSKENLRLTQTICLNKVFSCFSAVDYSLAQELSLTIAEASQFNPEGVKECLSGFMENDCFKEAEQRGRNEGFGEFKRVVTQYLLVFSCKKDLLKQALFDCINIVQGYSHLDSVDRLRKMLEIQESKGI